MISAVVLAAGKSERMGKNKLLLPLAGKPLLKWVLDVVCQTAIEDIVVVTGRDSDVVTDIAKAYRVNCVYNAAYKTGQASSIICGIKALNRQSRCSFFFMADQPLIDVNLVEHMIAIFQRGQILQPIYDHKMGTPVLFDACYYDDLKTITGDRGGKQVIQCNRRHVRQINWHNYRHFLDVDNQDDFKMIKKLIEQ